MLGAVIYETVAWLAQLGERRFADREVKVFKYRKLTPKISPGGSIFQRPFLRGLFLEGLI